MFYIFSCKDVDLKNLVDAWLLTQSSDIVGILTQYIEEYFYQGTAHIHNLAIVRVAI